MVPSLRALRALSIVAAESSFERAAQRLNVSRSAVSHLIRDLEQQLGVRLLERAARGVTVTRDGAALLAAMGTDLVCVSRTIRAREGGGG